MIKANLKNDNINIRIKGDRNKSIAELVFLYIGIKEYFGMPDELFRTVFESTLKIVESSESEVECDGK
jgi:hypothetical protein